MESFKPIFESQKEGNEEEKEEALELFSRDALEEDLDLEKESNLDDLPI